ncbi:EscU/YscU/HrcU family type III secretion system export apparatus switch protein [Acetivibrio cellulolyticus]|uniref:EscU/YscU/HrcU family type III secretion system export apparatus switch protein n=1 Tax=Acetivibrio cellulolyticus TaxID=35830 RepID=UPI0001E2E778|nr:EscU/YscU/HrcU family type III secretion system export apparatus switch protein [Acetivibrio cellulolyticus]
MPEKKDKVKQVAALKYSPQSNRAPEIIGLGSGEIAEKIIEKAKENDIPIYKNDELASTLSHFKIGDEIPPELYEVVAEILVFVSNIDKRFGDKKWKTR